jgi:hypothetical protein
MKGSLLLHSELNRGKGARRCPLVVHLQRRTASCHLDRSSRLPAHAASGETCQRIGVSAYEPWMKGSLLLH